MDNQKTMSDPESQKDVSSQNQDAPALSDTRQLANQDWSFPCSPTADKEEPNPYAGGQAIREFLDLYTGGRRNNAKEWMDYFTSGSFLDAAWDGPFAALLLEHVTRLETQYPVSREFLKWLCAAYQFTVAQAVYLNSDGSERTEYTFHISREAQFDGQESIFQIAVKGPAPRQLKGNELAVMHSFREYRRLVLLAEDGTWDEEAVGTFSQIIGRYCARCITDKCQQRGDRDFERHPAGLRLMTHFCRRDALPGELYRIAWQKLDLQTAVMGRAKIFWGPLRELALERLPELAGEQQVSFAKLRTDFHDYAVSTYKSGGENAQADEEDIQRTDAFFARKDFQQALLNRRFVEEEILRTWVAETCCDYYLKSIIRFYTEHETAPCAGLVIGRARKMLEYQTLADRLRRDREAKIPAHVLTLKSSPLFRHWLNTGFYQARDPESGIRLWEYLNQKLPFLPDWSKKFINTKDDTSPLPRVLTCALGDDTVEIRFHLRYIDFLLNGGPVYRPFLSWEQAAQLADTDTFFFLLPVTVASRGLFETVKAVLLRRLEDTAAPEDDRSLIAACLAGQVCRLPQPGEESAEEDLGEDLEEDLGEIPPNSLSPESFLPLELFAENADHLYGCSWNEHSQTLLFFEQRPDTRRWKPETRYEYISHRQAALSLAEKLLDEALAPPCLPVELLTNLPEAVYARPDFGVVCKNPNLSPCWSTPVRLLGTEVTGEELRGLLERFFAGAVDRLELSWKTTVPMGEEQGYDPRRSLVFLKGGSGYACLYFDDSRARSYALLEMPELYGKENGGISFVSFRQGRLFRHCLHRNVSGIRRHLSTIFSQVNQPGNVTFMAGGIWDYAVNVSHRRVKYNLDKQLLADFPMEWAHNRPDAPFYFSFPPHTAAWTDAQNQATALEVGENSLNRNRLQQALTQFLLGGGSKMQMTWGKEPGPRDHIVLLQDNGRFLMAWLTEKKQTAKFHVADQRTYMDVEGKKYPKDTFQGRVTPAYLIHDLVSLRNALDLLLANMDNPQIVTGKFAEYADEKPVKARPFKALYKELIL